MHYKKAFYKEIVRPVLFRIDPEKVHDLATFVGSFLGKFSLGRRIVGRLFYFRHSSLEQGILGITFRNPIGLAAGFDKNAKLTQVIPAVGFGFEEVGSITAKPCEGNPKPRMWRLPKRKSIVVYYGLKNDGVRVIAKRLGPLFKLRKIPLGISIAKTNCKETVSVADGIADYLGSFQHLCAKNLGDYITINVSCPNAYGGLTFTDAKRLEKLLSALDKVACDKPIFLKCSPDLSRKEVDALLKVCDRHRVHGLILSNLTKDRSVLSAEELASIGPGGISGKLAAQKAKGLISYVYKKTKGRYVLVAVGGISSANDAYELVKDGASLVQLITGMIYEGPQLIGEMNRELVKLLRKDGFEKISEAVGINHKRN